MSSKFSACENAEPIVPQWVPFSLLLSGACPAHAGSKQKKEGLTQCIAISLQIKYFRKMKKTYHE
jgi:hypothetical protein